MPIQYKYTVLNAEPRNTATSTAVRRPTKRRKMEPQKSYPIALRERKNPAGGWTASIVLPFSSAKDPEPLSGR